MVRQTMFESLKQKLSGTRPHNYSCDRCGKIFDSQEDLSRHESEKHATLTQPSGLQPFKCDRCGATFTSEKSLREHSEAIHQLPASPP